MAKTKDAEKKGEKRDELPAVDTFMSPSQIEALEQKGRRRKKQWMEDTSRPLENKKDVVDSTRGGAGGTADEMFNRVGQVDGSIKKKDAAYKKQFDEPYRTPFVKHKFKKRPRPEVTKVQIKTRRWKPPGPPKRPKKPEVELPPLTLRKWVPPYKRRRRRRNPLPRILPEVTKDAILYEGAKLNKIWHGFSQIDKSKMMLQGSIGCNSKKYSSTTAGSQTGAIALMCRAVLNEKTPAQLVKADVDDIIDQGDKYYKNCMLGLKCYKGKPALQLNQLQSSFYHQDIRYTVKLTEIEVGLLAKHPDDIRPEADLMSMMQKRVGKDYIYVLTIGGDKHFLIWGHVPTEQSNVKTVCYVMDPHMLDDTGLPNRLHGAGAIIRYAGINAFVLDFLANYGDMEAAKRAATKPKIALTEVEVVSAEPIERHPDYELDSKIKKIHCDQELNAMQAKALATVSKVSIATSKSRKKVFEFYKSTKEPTPQIPVQPEKPPAPPTEEALKAARGEDFFLYAPMANQHMFGRDDMLPEAKSELVLHSVVEVADNNYHSQYRQCDAEMWVLPATRHFGSQRYQQYKANTGLPCCVAALATLRRVRARAWNEDMVDDSLDTGTQLFQDSLLERGGDLRRLILAELNDSFNMQNTEYTFKVRGVAVWGRLSSSSPLVLNLTRGLEQFFKESDAGILQVPGEYEVAIWHEGGKYYMFDPYPADRKGNRVGLREGGKSYLASFTRIGRLSEHFLSNLPPDRRRKAFSISDVNVTEKKDLPEPVFQFKGIAPKRWIVSGRFHEGDARFPEENRNKQATPSAIAALAIAHVHDPSSWTPDNVDEAVIRGDILYGQTMNVLGPAEAKKEEGKGDNEDAGEEEEPSAGMAAADVLNKFRVSEWDCIETEVLDCLYNGQLNPPSGNGVLSLRDALTQMFREHSHAVVTARGGSVAVWKHDKHFYYFDPHGCDENGISSDGPRAAACLIRIDGTTADLAELIESNVAPGKDDSFNISPVSITATRLNEEIGVPETKLESDAFEWIKPGTAALLLGARGEHSAAGKVADKAGVKDTSGRTLALPAAAAFTAAAAAVPPPQMHQDHMHNFLEAGADYYLEHLKKTGREEMRVDDLSQKFELGANTFSIMVGDPITMPLKLPDPPVRLEEEAVEEEEEIGGEGEEEEEEEDKVKDIKTAMMATMYEPNSLALLVGDYHTLGVWCSAGGQVVAFDPAPTLKNGLLPIQRITKGDEIRLQRLADLAAENAGEGDEEAEEEEGEEEAAGEEKVSLPSIPDVVSPDACPALHVYASPSEFIDRLVAQGGLTTAQRLAPYKLYPVTVINELTSVLKEKKPGAAKKEEGDGDQADDEEEKEEQIEPMNPEAMGKNFVDVSRGLAVLRGRVAQNEEYFMDEPNRNNQDAAMAVMGIVVDNIEPYVHWKATLVDAILKYGDRLYTVSLPHARNRPHIKPDDVVKEFHVTNFNVNLTVETDVVTGDIKAGESGEPLSLKRGIVQFFESNTHGVLCAKDYCIGVWKAADGKALCMWEPHSVGPSGKYSSGGAAALVLFANSDQLADTFLHNVELLARPGHNRFSISSVKVNWQFIQIPGPPLPAGAAPDQGYEHKVLTAYVETARGRTILRGSRAPDFVKFARDTVLQSSCGAVVGACMSRVRRSELWTRRTVDEVLNASSTLFAASLAALGYEFRPGEDVLLPLQVLKRFVLGVNYIRFDLENVYSGKLEHQDPREMSVRCALERFFEGYTHGILWSVPHAVAVWRDRGAALCYMFEPHACGATGLRMGAELDGAACVLTFTSPKLMAFAYLQNIPATERANHEFQLYAVAVSVHPIKPLGGVAPPLVKPPPGMPAGQAVLPATSKVYLDGRKRQAKDEDRRHPPGSKTCLEAQRAVESKDKDKLKGHRNTSGWLVTNDGAQFLSAEHSMACRRYSMGSRGNQGLACSVMAVAMSRVEDVCRWTTSTLDQVLDSGDQLYKDSYLHFKPRHSKFLQLEQVLRKFYTPGNCVCRVVVYRARHRGDAGGEDLYTQLNEFFREERSGVIVSGSFAAALFRTPRGYYMFDADDRDRFGRAVAPQCKGRARACLSHFPTVQMLADKLRGNIPPATVTVTVETEIGPKEVEEPAEGGTMFMIHGLDVTNLRKLNQFER